MQQLCMSRVQKIELQTACPDTMKMEEARPHQKSVEWANADARLDPEGDNLPHDRWQELRLSAMTTQGKRPRQPDRVLDEPRET